MYDNRSNLVTSAVDDDEFAGIDFVTSPTFFRVSSFLTQSINEIITLPPSLYSTSVLSLSQLN